MNSTSKTTPICMFSSNLAQWMSRAGNVRFSLRDPITPERKELEISSLRHSIRSVEIQLYS